MVQLNTRNGRPGLRREGSLRARLLRISAARCYPCPALRPLRPALALALLLLAAPVVAALPEHAERVVDYDIEVRLDADKHELTGTQRLTWRNPSDDAVPDLWFHLYLNAFRNSESTFFRESGGQLRSDRTMQDNWGWIDVTALRLAGGADLLPAMTFEAPDDGNPEDRTVARVVLPEPVAPRGEITLEVEFHAVLPRVYARTGHAGDFHMIGQWFPKLGVYEPAGMRGRETGGWNCHQFHAHSEFYADYGHYRVAMTAPADFAHGATGRRIEARDNPDGTRTWVHEQEDVHDFAWTVDPRYVEVVDRFVAASDVTAADLAAAAALLGRPAEDLRLSDVEIRLLLQPEHRAQADRHLAAAKLALRWYGLAYGRYPYPTLTIVDPPAHAGGAAGMEYPTLITAGTSIAVGRGPLARVRLPEIVTVHEFGHQYWYGLVGSNEFEESWLDEGFTTYSTERALAAGYGEATANAELPGGLRVGAFDMARMQNGPGQRFERIRTPSWGFSRSSAYGFNSYGRPALVLRTLDGLLGEATMARALRTYHERWRFRHPRSEDFYAVVEEVSGRDLDDFFAQVVEGPGVFDPAVVRLRHEEVRSPRGRIERGGVVTTVDEAMARLEDDAAELEVRSIVELRHLGEVRLPVEVELRYDDDTTERRTWEGEARWARWEIVDARRVVEVTLDPERKLALDASRLNNARREEPDRRAAALWSLRLLAWTQRLMGMVGL